MLVWFSSRTVLDFQPNKYKWFWRIWGADRARLCFLQSYMCYSFSLLFALAVCSIVFLLLRTTANFLIKEITLQPLSLFIWALCPYQSFQLPKRFEVSPYYSWRRTEVVAQGRLLLLTLLRTRHQAPHGQHIHFIRASNPPLAMTNTAGVIFQLDSYIKKIVTRNKYHFVLGFTAYWALSLKGFKSHHALRESCSEKEDVEGCSSQLLWFGKRLVLTDGKESGTDREAARADTATPSGIRTKLETWLAGIYHFLYIVTLINANLYLLVVILPCIFC